MNGRPLYTLHPRPLTVLYGDLANHAAAQGEVLIGTPGSLLQRENAAGFRFYARQFYDADSKKREQYVAGPVGDAVADQAAEQLRLRMEEARTTAQDLRLLGREGYQLADPRAFAALASLHNHGVFRAGAVLIGSHAFGVLLNQLGARAAGYATEDVDVARQGALAFAEPPRQSLLEMLGAPGIAFVEVPGLDARQPATSWKEQGRSRFQVDLLVPSPDDTFGIVAVPELQAHAQALPYLRYLLGETHSGLLLARDGCCQVRVPAPERFAVHKLLVAELRGGSHTEVRQATVLLAVLAEQHPGAIEDALAAVPVSAGKLLRRGVARVREVLGNRELRVGEVLAEFCV